jgi:hypothetical protein
MFLRSYVIGAVALSLGVLAKEKPFDPVLHEKLYANGVRHMEIRNRKEVCFYSDTD